MAKSVKIAFSVRGTVKQTIELEEGVDAKTLLAQLDIGDALTTIQVGGIVESYDGIKLGTVISVTNQCEYDDFECIPDV